MDSFVVIGLGSFGMSLARELYRMGHEVLAVDKNEDVSPPDRRFGEPCHHGRRPG